LKERYRRSIVAFLKYVAPATIIVLIGCTNLPAQTQQASITSLKLRAAVGDLTINTRDFVLEIYGTYVLPSTNFSQPIEGLVLNFKPAAPGRLTGAANTKDIKNLMDAYHIAYPQLSSFELDVPITVQGSIADIAGAELSFIVTGNIQLPFCSAQLTGSQVAVKTPCVP
jgi:hypothetical protein